MSTLYEISADMAALRDLLAEVGGDVSDEAAEAALDQWLQEHADDLTEKLEDYRYMMRQLEASAAFRRSEAAVRLEAAKRDEANVERMKRRLMEFFRAHEMRRVDLPSGGWFSVSANGGKTPVELLVPPESLPEAWRRAAVTYYAETDAIRAALEAGDALPFARLGERGQHLRVR